MARSADMIQTSKAERVYKHRYAFFIVLFAFGFYQEQVREFEE